MYAVLQTRFEHPSSSNNKFGIVGKGSFFKDKNGSRFGVSYEDIANALKELELNEFKENDVGFYLILE